MGLPIEVEPACPDDEIYLVPREGAAFTTVGGLRQETDGYTLARRRESRESRVDGVRIACEMFMWELLKILPERSLRAAQHMERYTYPQPVWETTRPSYEERHVPIAEPMVGRAFSGLGGYEHTQYTRVVEDAIHVSLSGVERLLELVLRAAACNWAQDSGTGDRRVMERAVISLSGDMRQIGYPAPLIDAAITHGRWAAERSRGRPNFSRNNRFEWDPVSGGRRVEQPPLEGIAGRIQDLMHDMQRDGGRPHAIVLSPSNYAALLADRRQNYVGAGASYQEAYQAQTRGRRGFYEGLQWVVDHAAEQLKAPQTPRQPSPEAEQFAAELDQALLAFAKAAS